jgi:ribulose-5-phosphate 4-epimerase/fuculose-1-phosphate aldolase
MTTPDPQTLREFTDAAHKAASLGLLSCSSGNLSARLDQDRFLASASGSWLAELTADQIALCRLSDGASLNNLTPTVEIRFHQAILKMRPDVNVVLHFQSPYATAVAADKDPLRYNFNVIIEVPVYIKTPACIEFHPPGSPELAACVAEKMRDREMLIMKNHGLVTVGTGYRDAIQKATFFELACRILLTAPEAQPLTDEQVKAISLA